VWCGLVVFVFGFWCELVVGFGLWVCLAGWFWLVLVGGLCWCWVYSGLGFWWCFIGFVFGCSLFDLRLIGWFGLRVGSVLGAVFCVLCLCCEF